MSAFSAVFLPDEDSERTPLLPVDPKSPGASGRAVPTKHKWLIMAGCQAAVFLGAVDMTICATLLSPIASSFHASHQASWLGTSFLLSNITFTPLYGRLCGILGRRLANASAISLFTLGTLFCAIAPSMKYLILARFIAGAGGGGMFTTSTVIAADLFPLKQRGLVGGVTTGIWAVGGALGGPLGGWVADHWGWRAAFVFQVPLLIVALLSGLVHINYEVASAQVESARAKLARVDFLGVGTLFLAFGSFLVSLSLRNNERLPWSNVWVITSTALAPVFFALFILVEAFWAREPVLPFRLLTHQTPLFVCFVTVSVAVCNFGMMYNFPNWFLIQGSTAGGAGAHLLPTSIGNVLGGVTAGVILSKTGKYQVPNIAAGLVSFVGVVLIASLTFDSAPAFQWLDILPMGFGFGYILNTSFVALMASVPHSDIPAVTGVLWLFRTTGQVVGVASTAAILQGVLSPELTRRITGPDAEEIIKLIREDTNVLATLPPAIQTEAREAYAVALTYVFFFCAGFAFLAWLSVIFIPQLTLEEKRETTVEEEVVREESVQE